MARGRRQPEPRIHHRARPGLRLRPHPGRSLRAAQGIYLERGYRLRDIPRLILEKNLYGLDIDDRAAQLAGFALLMKARADDRRLFNDPPRLNVLSLQESKGLDAGRTRHPPRALRRAARAPSRRCSTPSNTPRPSAR
jgi:hypothetical protein